MLKSREPSVRAMNGHRARKIDVEVMVGLGTMLASWKRSAFSGLGESSAVEPERFNDSGYTRADSRDGSTSGQNTYGNADRD